MRLSVIIFSIAIVCSVSIAEAIMPKTNSASVVKPPFATNAPSAQKTIPVQEMLVLGPPQLKLHSLTMIDQGKVEDGVDDSFLPGLKVCAEDPNTPIRSLTARLLGQNFIQGKDEPNPEAVMILKKLAQDESTYVHYNAVYHGLSHINNKSEGIIEILLQVASMNREQGLYERTIESLKDHREQVISILDQKLTKDGSIAIYEIYEDFTGKKPPNHENYLDLPSSRPRLFIFKGDGGDSAAYSAKFEQAVKAAGVKEPDVTISGEGDSYVLMLKTYLTKDYLAVEEHFSKHDVFKLTQDMWLTPELEARIEMMRKKKK